MLFVWITFGLWGADRIYPHPFIRIASGVTGLVTVVLALVGN
jgi:hypothetical protein